MNKPVMPSEIQTASAEATKLFDSLKAEWDARRDAEYEKFFNDPRVVELDEKAHALRDQVDAWERENQPKKPRKDHLTLDMTADKIADKPRPKGARPTMVSIAWDCRDGAMLRDEALFRGVTEVSIERGIVETLLRQVRAKK